MKANLLRGNSKISKLSNNIKNTLQLPNMLGKKSYSIKMIFKSREVSFEMIMSLFWSRSPQEIL